MHAREYHVGTYDSLQMRNFRRRLGRARFRGEAIDLDAWMWNSGALGLHPAHFPVLADWIAFLDEVHPSNRKPILEQFSIAWLLQRRLQVISPCDDVLLHYFADKDRHLAAIAERLERLPRLPRGEALAWLREQPIRLEGSPPPMRKATFLQRLRTVVRERLPLRRSSHG
jgi:hypothetical protein